MSAKLTRSIFTLLTLAITPVTLHAQQPGAPDLSQLPAEAQAVLAELQQVQAEIAPIQQQALADPVLRAEQAALGEQIQTAMTEVDPAIPQQVERLQELAAEAQSAQAAQDEARIGEIVAAARTIQIALQDAQTQAIRRPDLAPRVEAFQQKVQAKMVEVNPTADALIERMEALEKRFMALMAQPQ